MKTQKLKFFKIKRLEHTGILHPQIMREFEKSIEAGTKFCESYNLSVEITDILLTVQGKDKGRFYFAALCATV